MTAHRLWKKSDVICIVVWEYTFGELRILLKKSEAASQDTRPTTILKHMV